MFQTFYRRKERKVGRLEGWKEVVRWLGGLVVRISVANIFGCRGSILRGLRMFRARVATWSGWSLDIQCLIDTGKSVSYWMVRIHTQPPNDPTTSPILPFLHFVQDRHLHAKCKLIFEEIWNMPNNFTFPMQRWLTSGGVFNPKSAIRNLVKEIDT